jgi:hypothetical protein
MSGSIQEKLIPTSAYIKVGNEFLTPTDLSIKVNSLETSRIDMGKKIKVLSENYQVPRNTTYFLNGQLSLQLKSCEKIADDLFQKFIADNILLYRDNVIICHHSVEILDIKKCENAEKTATEYVVNFVARAFFAKQLVQMSSSYELKMFDFFGSPSIQINPLWGYPKIDKKPSSSPTSSTSVAQTHLVNMPSILIEKPTPDFLRRMYIEQVGRNKELQRKNNELEASLTVKTTAEQQLLQVSQEQTDKIQELQRKNNELEAALTVKTAAEQQLLQVSQEQTDKIQELERQGIVMTALLYVKTLREQMFLRIDDENQALQKQLAELVTQMQGSEVQLHNQRANNERLYNEFQDLANFNATQTRQLESRKRTRD